MRIGQKQKPLNLEWVIGYKTSEIFRKNIYEEFYLRFINFSFWRV